MKLIKHLNPLKTAIGYAVLATGTTLLCAGAEGSLAQPFQVLYQGTFFPVFPLLGNYSTLIDFLILNPLMIYFLLKGYKQIKTKNGIIAGFVNPTPYHKIGQVVLSGIMASVFMWYYYRGFLEGTYFDAIIQPDEIGNIKVTFTGWVVFVWTTLIIFVLLFFSFSQIAYIRFLLGLKPKDIIYQPKHEDQAGGQSYLTRPLFNYFYASLVLALVFLVFMIYDNSGDGIQESRRFQGALVFLIVAVPTLFLPIFHLRKLMQARKNEYVSALRTKANKVYEEIFKPKDDQLSAIANELNYINYLERYNDLVKQLPTWPMPLVTITIPSVSVAIAIFKIILEVLKIPR